ncbi:hypothetical protein [Lysinibacillus sp. NPDC047702]|uniref:hypothetical protein n=1 Tax=unclassified Lysinibacillus TaxID=2636778 RepID=UPI003CFE58A8
MGATDTGSTKITQSETGGAATGSGNSSASSAKNTGGRRGNRGTTAAVNATKGNELVDVDKKPKSVTIDVPGADKDKDKEPPKKETRGRPRGSTAKPRTTTAKTKAKIDATQISVLLQTMTAIIAARPNMAPFAMTKDEADQLAKPLANIIGKSDAFAEAAGEYADHITLLVAAITIFVPKFLMYKMQRDAAIAQIPKIQEVKHDTTANNKTGEASRGSSNSPGQNRDTTSLQNNGSTNTGSTISYLGSPI